MDNETSEIMNLKDKVVGNASREENKSGEIRANTIKMGQMLTSLYIEDCCLKLMTVKGKQVVQWAELPLERGLVKDGVIIAPEIMANKIADFLRKQNVNGNKIIIGFSGLHCFSRVITLPAVKKSVLNEAVRREAERELPISLTNFYLAWQIIQTSKKQYKIFVIAHARNTMDALLQTFKKAEIKPYLADLAPLALSRLTNQDTVGIADISQCSLDIIIQVKGIPELIRSLPLDQNQPISEKLSIIKEELERTIKFYNSSKSGIAHDSELPFFITGEVLDSPQLYQSLVNDLGPAVENVILPLEYPDGLNPMHYAVNAGLILKRFSPKGWAAPSPVNLNVFPRSQEKDNLNFSKMFLASGALVAVGAIVGMVVLLSNVNGSLKSLSSEVNTSQSVLTQRQALRTSSNSLISALEKKVSDSTQTSVAYSLLLEGFSSQSNTINGDLQLAVANLQPDMTFSVLRYSQNSLSISGIAPNEGEVFDFSRLMAVSGRYSAVTISNLLMNQDHKMEFDLILETAPVSQ